MCRFKVIDVFEVANHPDQEASTNLKPGIWYVLDGAFISLSEFPKPDENVVITLAGGRTFEATVSSVAVRHGAAAISFSHSVQALPLAKIRPFDDFYVDRQPIGLRDSAPQG